MKTIKIEAVETLTPAMERLRRTDYGKNASDKIWTDEFDARSVHILATCEKEPIGMIRLTINSPPVLQTWSKGKAPIPGGSGVADLTRAIVAKRWRSFDIFKLLMTETLIEAKKSGVRNVVAAVEPDAKHRRCLYKFGFRDVGELVNFNHPPVGDTLCQCLIQFPQNDFLEVLEVRRKLLSGWRLQNFKIVSSIAGRESENQVVCQVSV